MTPKSTDFRPNKDIIISRYYNYRRGYSENYVFAIDDFLDNRIFNRWRVVLEENNYRKKGRPYKIRGIAILYLVKLRELRGILFMQLQSNLHNLSMEFKFPEMPFTSIYRRIRKIILEITSNNGGVLIAVDAPWFKITLGEDYLGNK